MKVNCVWWCCAIVASMGLALAAPAAAALVTFEASDVYSGSRPTGTSPWWTATFDDQDTAGSVTMTITAANLSNTEFLSKTFFNLDPSLSPDTLVFTSAVGAGSFDAPSISSGADAFTAGAGKRFDILISFPVGGPRARFTDGDQAVFTITGIPTLTATSFNTFSTGGSHDLGPYAVAAHVQGIDASQSGWTTVPEPATLGLLAVGGLVIVGRRWKRSHSR